jgi:3-mercaptopyruvate sulfurtransferase SseA
VVWALRSLGHDRIVMVDGGLPALLRAGVPQVQPPVGQGRFIVERRDDWSIDPNAASRDLVRLEARAMSELLGPDGQLKPRPEIAAWLAAKGIDHDTLLATDAAWLTAVLIDTGYHARQVVGSAEYALTAAN